MLWLSYIAIIALIFWAVKPSFKRISFALVTVILLQLSFINQKNKKIKTDKYLISKIHKTIKKVTEDIDSFAFNTAVSSLMILLNDFEAETQTHKDINQKDFLDFLKKETLS